jgi:MSHA biogenesis protein MshJ
MNTATLNGWMKRFDKLSLRERCVLSGALLIFVLMVWYSQFMEPLTNRQRAISTEVDSLQQEVNSAADTIQVNDGTDAQRLAAEKVSALEATLKQLNTQLDSAQTGLIAPERMKEVIHDVLSRQHGLKLVSLHNEAVHPLIDPTTATPAAEGEAGTEQKNVAPAESTGPYVHPVELIVEGNYLDVLAYLRALESLPWHFYWKTLEIQTLKYPTNRVRLEICTLSMDKEWLGV